MEQLSPSLSSSMHDRARDSAHHRGMREEAAQPRSRLRQLASPFRLLTVLLVVTFLLGGGSRGDILSLVLLRPFALIVLGLGLITLEARHIRAQRFVFAMALAILLFVGIQLVPLPPEIWHQLPGRDLIREIDQAAGLDATWRPLTLDPLATRNALFALAIPLAALVLGAQLDEQASSRLVPWVLWIGLASALLGLVQALSDPQGPLYLYRMTNKGSAVGLFANRNHQALFLALLLPMLAFWTARQKASRPLQLLACLAGLTLLPFILVTGSRAGVVVAAVGLISCLVFLHRSKSQPRTQSRRHRRGLILAGGILALVLVGLTVFLGRAVGWERIGETRIEDELRWAILPTAEHMLATYFPAGSGTGTFERVFRVHEPDSVLGPAYMQQAHNDWLDAILTGGFAAAALLAAAVAAFGRRVLVLVRQGGKDDLATLGLIIILLVALASITDYPLRVPSLACLFVLAAIWAGRTTAVHKSDLTWDANPSQTPPDLRETP